MVGWQKGEQMVPGIEKGPVIELHHSHIDTTQKEDTENCYFLVPAVPDQGREFNSQYE